MQNTPPGAWETALHSRVPGCTMSQMEDLLNKDRLLLQAWSYRGAPVVFPEAESDVFLYSLASIDHGGEKEPWIYTSGISLALEYLQMDFDELLELLMRVMPRLDDALIISKNSLDQTLASHVWGSKQADGRRRGGVFPSSSLFLSRPGSIRKTPKNLALLYFL